MNTIEFTAVWNAEAVDAGWDIFLDGERFYYGVSTEELSTFAENLLASNDQLVN